MENGSRQGRSADQDQQGSGGGHKSWSDKSGVYTGEKDEKTEEQNSPATGGTGITGTVRVGETLTADTSGISDSDGLDGAKSATNRWPEASTFKGQPEPVIPRLKTMRERPSVSGSASPTVRAAPKELTSPATEAVHPPPSPATGQPDITGTSRVGEALKTDTSGISDADGMENASFTYRWTACGTDVPGAAGASCNLTKD